MSRHYTLILAILAVGCGDPPEHLDRPDPAGVVYLTDTERLARISLSIRGLRPTAEEISAVATDGTQIEKLVDQWLDSDAYGRRIRDLHNENLKLRTDVDEQMPLVGLLRDRDTSDVHESTTEAALRLIEHVVANDLPYTEIVTADYMLTNDTLATIYGLNYDGIDHEWQKSTWSDGRPMAGILSDSELWRRHQSNGSNFHRGRANMLADQLLCSPFATRDIDVEGGIDLSDDLAVAHAVTEIESCIGCHQAMDPMAGFLWGFQGLVLAYAIENAHLKGCAWEPTNPDDPPDQYPEDYCYPLRIFQPSEEDAWIDYELRPPGYYGQPGSGLDQLGAHIADDPRFAQCAVRRFYAYFTQTPRDDVPTDLVRRLQDDFVASGYDAKALTRAIVLTDGFRVAQVTGEPGHEVVGLQTLRPEAHGDVVEQLTGFRWLRRAEQRGGVKAWGVVDLTQSDRYGFRAMTGGIDSLYVLSPVHTAQPIKTIFMGRLGEEAAGWVVDHDFQLPAEERRLLTLVEPTDVDEGLIRAQLQALHLAILSEALPIDDLEIDATWDLFSGALARGTPESAWKLTISVLLQDPRMVYY